MNNEPLISIVVPAYNMEQFINTCIESILDQFYQNWEMIIVNDGSTDHTEEICHQYVSSDKRIKVYSRMNGGASSAKNTGLKHVNGELLCFLDADDWYDKNFLSYMSQELLNYQADIVMCDFSIQGKAEHQYVEELLEEPDIINGFIEGKITKRTTNKMYRMSLVKDIQFPDGRDLVEDGVWTTNVLERCRRMRIIPDPLYHVRIREGSITRRRRRKENEVVGYFRNILEIDTFILKHIRDKNNREAARNVLSDLEMIYSSCCNLSLWEVNEFGKSVGEIHNDYLQSGCSSYKQRKLLEFLKKIKKKELIAPAFHISVLFSFHTSIKEKAEMIKMIFVSLYRRTVIG